MGFKKIDIPNLAFGTFPLKGDSAKNAVFTALELGYRHIDTAQMYENELEVGKAIKASGLSTDKIFLTTKILPENYTLDRFIDSLKKSCDELQVDKVNLLLLHWPPIDKPLEPILDLLGSSLTYGLTERIGVSNFTSSLMEIAARYFDNQIAVNQVEFHPLLDQSKLLQKASSLNIKLMSFCSLARGKVVMEPVIKIIAEKYAVSPGAVALSWIMQQNVVATVMSSNRDRARNNMDSVRIHLNNNDMQLITELTQKHLRLVSPPGLAPEWDE